MGVFFSALAFLGLTLGITAQAAGTAPGISTNAGGGFSWNDGKHAECDQECLYKKANEYLSLQSEYIYKKLEKLKEFSGFGNSKANPDEMLRLLGAFCTDEERSNKLATHCYERYRDLQLLSLNKARAALVRNSNAASSLTSGYDPITGTQLPTGDKAIARVRDSNAESLRPIVADLPTFSDLQKLEDDRMLQLTLQGSASNAYSVWQEWLGSIENSYAPSEADFIQFEAVDKKDAKKGYKIKTGSDGKPEVDREAFKKAQAKYSKIAEDIKKDVGLLRYNPTATVIKDVNSSRAAIKNATPLPERELKKEIYGSARKGLLDSAEKQIKEAGLPTVPVIQFPGSHPPPSPTLSTRLPASLPTSPAATGPAINRSQGPSGKQVLQSNLVDQLNRQKVPQKPTAITTDDYKKAAETPVSNVGVSVGSKDSVILNTGYSPELYSPNYLDYLDK